MVRFLHHSIIFERLRDNMFFRHGCSMQKMCTFKLKVQFKFRLLLVKCVLGISAETTYFFVSMIYYPHNFKSSETYKHLQSIGIEIILFKKKNDILLGVKVIVTVCRRRLLFIVGDCYLSKCAGQVRVEKVLFFNKQCIVSACASTPGRRWQCGLGAWGGAPIDAFVSAMIVVANDNGTYMAVLRA